MNYWTLAKYGVPALLILAVAITINNRAYDRGFDVAETHCTAVRIPAEKKKVQDQCDELNALTQEENHASHNRLNDITAQYVGLLKQYDRCSALRVTSGSGGSGDISEAAEQTSGIEIALGWLTDLIYESDIDASNQIACVNTLRKIYKQYGQENKLPN